MQVPNTNRAIRNLMEIIIDYDAILAELQKGVKTRINDYDYKVATLGKNLTLREINTIVIGSPRQTGKTDWAIDVIKKNPNACIFYSNQYMYDQALMKSADVNQLVHYKNTIANKSFPYTDFNLFILDSLKEENGKNAYDYLISTLSLFDIEYRKNITILVLA